MTPLALQCRRRNEFFSCPRRLTGFSSDPGVLAISQTSPPAEVLGLSSIFDCAGSILAEVKLVEHASRVLVVVVDCNEAVCTSLRVCQPPFPKGPEPFSQEDLSIMPYVPGLLLQVDACIKYSVAEADAEALTAPKARERPRQR